MYARCSKQDRRFGQRLDYFAALPGAWAARFRGWLCHHHPARLHDGSGLRRRGNRIRGDGLAAGDGAPDPGGRLDRAEARFACAPDLRRWPDGRNRRRISEYRALRPARAGRVCRHDQSVRRRSRRSRAAGARGAGPWCNGSEPHPCVRALQPDRRALHGRGIARGVPA